MKYFKYPLYLIYISYFFITLTYYISVLLDLYILQQDIAYIISLFVYIYIYVHMYIHYVYLFYFNGIVVYIIMCI